MQGTFTDIIRASYEWTKTVLFKPFRFKKWIFLCLIALLAAEFSGCNLNINFPTHKPGQANLPITIQPIPFIPITIAFLIIGLAIFTLFLWLYSRFSFIFLNSVVNNDASIKTPFRENKNIGNSFFKWSILLIIFTITITLLMALILLGGIVFLDKLQTVWKIILTILWILVSIFIIIFIALVYVIIHDLVLPIMFKEKKHVLKGWKDALTIIKNEKINFAKYLLIKLGLRIATGIAAGLFAMAVMFALLIQLGILGGLLYTISFALPEVIKLGYYIFLIALGVIALLAIIFLVNLALLPIPIFFRTYSLKFLASLDNKYDLFKKRGQATPTRGSG